MNRLRFTLPLLALLVFGPPAAAQSLEDFEKKVTEFTLDNGLHFIIIERHEAPVVSFVTWADVGGVDAPKGQTGIPHMFEHMAFKGTPEIGTKGYEQEKVAIEAVDRAYAALEEERHKGPQADPERIAALEAAFEEAIDAAREWVENAEFDEIVTREGAVGMNAGTSTDATFYWLSLPSNKLELWFSVESARFLNPVLREFYVERDVVQEERRMSTESSPFGRLYEELVTTAFKAHPYGTPNIGHMSDLESISREDARAFFDKYYGASNLTIAMAGDVDPDRTRKLAETYFGRLPAKSKPEPITTVEPPQLGQRRVVLEEQAQPILMVGFHVGDVNHPDQPVLTVIDDILTRGRTSRLYTRMVEEDKSAVQASAYLGIPGDKYPSLYLFLTVPSQGVTAEENETTLFEELQRLADEPVSDEELEKAKRRARADLVRQLGSNSGLAQQLAGYHVSTGDWRNLFRELEAIDAVSVEDVMRVAKETFTPSNSTVALIRTKSAQATAAN